MKNPVMLEGGVKNNKGGFVNVCGSAKNGTVRVGMYAIPDPVCVPVGLSWRGCDEFDMLDCDVVFTYHTPESIQATIDTLEKAKLKLLQHG